MSKPGSIAQSRRALEARFRLTCDTVLANVKSTIEQEKAALLREFDERLSLQSQLPGMDLSSYDVVQKFDFHGPNHKSMVHTVRISEPTNASNWAICNVTTEPGAEYEGFVLIRRKPIDGAKTQ